ncbi:uncharacterized protein CMC5_052710 [Chondromyces crocatus]|uniref:Uncharacterized protein n=1 Tax=Chondromyces crocatus TaxID=52 RepID=A0A0K1EJS8_CHOCO|nr:uncharacterized protein CMC5_052710 [Chondromyces crocatus]
MARSQFAPSARIDGKDRSMVTRLRSGGAPSASLQGEALASREADPPPGQMV